MRSISSMLYALLIVHAQGLRCRTHAVRGMARRAASVDIDAANAKAAASSKGTDLPWYFNLLRKRAGAEGEETTSFSPLGEEAKSFHEPQRFSRIYVQ